MLKRQIDGCLNKKKEVENHYIFLLQEIIFNWEQIQV